MATTGQSPYKPKVNIARSAVWLAGLRELTSRPCRQMLPSGPGPSPRHWVSMEHCGRNVGGRGACLFPGTGYI